MLYKYERNRSIVASKFSLLNLGIQFIILKQPNLVVILLKLSQFDVLYSRILEFGWLF